VRVLIAGCDGLLGQNLVRSAPVGVEIVGLARHEAPLLPARLSAYHVRDIADPDTWRFVREVIRPDRILNAAAYTDVDGCERDPAKSDRVNRDAVRAMAATGIPLAQVSTDYVFDGESGPYSEEAATNPLSAYGRSKLESEEATLSVPGNLVVRTAWVWGPALSARGGAKKSFTDFVRETLAANKTARIVTDQWSNPTLAADLAGAIWALVRGQHSGLYHASGSDWVSRLEWAKRVATFFGLDAGLIEPITTADMNPPARRPLRSGLSGAKLERDTGFRLRGLDAQLAASRAAA
jgi:dTDP-4-dehydrorhamnose reductase